MLTTSLDYLLAWIFCVTYGVKMRGYVRQGAEMIERAGIVVVVIVNGGFVLLRKVLSAVFASKRQSGLVTWSKSTVAKTAGDKRNAKAKVIL